jgi:hypothetical protein
VAQKEIETITLNNVEYVRKDSVLPLQNNTETFPYVIGKLYFIRTVTFYYIGRLLAVTSAELIVDQCSWVADTGRFADALKNGTISENEPFPDGQVIIGRGTIVDAHVWAGSAMRSQK